MKNRAARTKPRKLIRCTSPSGHVAMEVFLAVQSGTPLRALGVQLKRGVSARRVGNYNEVPQAIQKKSRPSPSNCVTPFACKLLSEQGFEVLNRVKKIP